MAERRAVPDAAKRNRTLRQRRVGGWGVRPQHAARQPSDQPLRKRLPEPANASKRIRRSKPLRLQSGSFEKRGDEIGLMSSTHLAAIRKFQQTSRNQVAQGATTLPVRTAL